MTDDAIISHSLKSLFPQNLWIGNLLFCLTLAAICFRSYQYFFKSPEFFVFFGMAFCSYLAAIAFDYHLILAYPLLFWVAYKAYEKNSPWLMGLVVFGYLSFFWDRNLLLIHKKSNELIWGQLLFYIGLLVTTPKWIEETVQPETIHS
jgi:hypothetical protein